MLLLQINASADWNKTWLSEVFCLVSSALMLKDTKTLFGGGWWMLVYFSRDASFSSSDAYDIIFNNTTF